MGKHAQGLLMDCISAKLKNNIWDRAAKFQCVICALEEDNRYAKLQFLLCYFCLQLKWRDFPWLKWILDLAQYSQDPLGYLRYSSRNVKVKNWNRRVERKGSENCWKTDKRVKKETIRESQNIYVGKRYTTQKKSGKRQHNERREHFYSPLSAFW